MPSSDSGSPDLAAGTVPVRDAAGQLQVLLVHRRRYDDWSFPKGHLEAGEQPVTAAIRETAEESGLVVRLGPPLPALAYPLGGDATKLVRFWLAEQLGPTGEPIDADEVDRTYWCGLDEARTLLTYTDERALLDEVTRLRPAATPGRAVLVLRHARARPRDGWGGPDALRPLDRRGQRQVSALVPLLGAYGPTRVVSSDSLRCRATVEEFAASHGLPVRLDSRLSEQTTPAGICAAVQEVRADLVADGGAAVLCSHRPTLPDVLATLGMPPVSLAKGAFAVAHLTAAGDLLAAEVHES